MKLNEIDYPLPEELIAQYPLKRRDECRLFIYDRNSDKIEHRIFKDIINYLNKGDVLVFNNTKVFSARLYGVKKKTSAKLEILLLKRKTEREWEALIRPAKRVKKDTDIVITDSIQIKVIKRLGDGNFLIEFNKELSYKEIDKLGKIPLPPYIKREQDEEIDREYYQTVYAKKYGAIAAPTAGFHFTEELIKKIEGKGINIAYITLHISWGTFAPIRAENIEQHKMHSEYLIIDEKNAAIINNRCGRCIAVGTSVVRALESASDNNKVFPFEGEVDTYIYPGYKFKIVDSIITNFHLPKTSLLLLVGAFIGVKKLKELYNIAIKERYRFYSYGDAMLLL